MCADEIERARKYKTKNERTHCCLVIIYWCLVHLVFAVVVTYEFSHSPNWFVIYWTRRTMAAATTWTMNSVGLGQHSRFFGHTSIWIAHTLCDRIHFILLFVPLIAQSVQMRVRISDACMLHPSSTTHYEFTRQLNGHIWFRTMNVY